MVFRPEASFSPDASRRAQACRTGVRGPRDGACGGLLGDLVARQFASESGHGAVDRRPADRRLSRRGFQGMAAARLAILIATLILAGAAGAVTPIGAPGWRDLNAEQREILAPLAGDWNGMSEPHRQKWIGIADSYGRLTREEQERIRARMKAWADLQPEQRERARDQYRTLRNIPPDKREALPELWQRYRSIPPEARQSQHDRRDRRAEPRSPLRADDK
ncbi:hypothetical protein ebA7126 [Aromatoleum aromaticum EbN1]|uniref:Transmembrane protein n=2 Tax=Aromatoleum aromaticum TaxID=551760 RepID=Q5NXP8_AROAE|nr:hypothetical protein ebA7126 [Aromatoleum aromaticum EbN1]